MARAGARRTAPGHRFAAAERFVDAAEMLCAEAVALGARGAGVLLHRESGPPALAVDNLPELADEHRLYTVTRAHWNDNPLFGALRRRIGVLDGEDLGGIAFVEVARDHGYQGTANEALFAPLIAPGGWFGTVACVLRRPADAVLERELSLLATELSVWCTAHGIGRLPDLAVPELPARQHQIARLAASGRTNVEIAGELGISVNTVKLRLKQAFERLHVNNRTELANVLRRLAPLDGVPEGVTHRGAIAITRARR